MDSSQPSIGEYLYWNDWNDSAPYGTSLAPESFTYSIDPQGEPRWKVQGLNAQGEPAAYVLSPSSPSSGQYFQCTVNGKPALYTDIAYREPDSSIAGLEDWYDWILRQDAAGHLKSRATARPWEGPDLTTMMFRLRHRVVGYEQHERPVSWHDSLEGFQHWLDECTASSPMRLLAYAIKEFPHPRSPDDFWDSSTMLHYAHDISARVGLTEENTKYWSRQMFHTAFREDQWFSGADLARPFEIRLAAFCEGAQVERYAGNGFVPFSTLENFLTTSQEESSTAWWGIHLVDSPLVLAFPRRYAHAMVDIDNDGASLTLTMALHEHRVEQLIAKDRFNRTWGKWLDPDAVLSPEEIAQGIAQVEQDLADLARSQTTHNA